MIGVDKLDSTAPEYFQQRMKATKVVLDRLSVPEREEIDAEVNKIKETGYEPEVQRE
jgi:hypothetical protein